MPNNPIKLSELTRQVEQLIQGSFGGVSTWVIAEISNHTFYPNNDRHYFTFIEKMEGVAEPLVKIQGVAWSTGSEKIKAFEKTTGQVFTDGIQVLVEVKLDYQSKYGLKLTLVDINPEFTLGKLPQQREATLLRLVNENPPYIQKRGEEYWTKNKSLPFNLVLQHIAVIGSPHSDGFADFMGTIRNNKFGFTFAVDIYQSSVQGEFAAKEMRNRLIEIYQSEKPYDCVVMLRGGGERTDLLAFDSYELAQAVARFPIPIITGIGHITDISIVDLMAHTSTNVPTKAGEVIVAQCRKFDESMVSFANEIIMKAQNRFHLSKAKLTDMKHQLVAKPQLLLAEKEHQLDKMKSNLKIFTNQLINQQQTSLLHWEATLKLVSPINILKRGFALIKQKDKVIVSGKHLAPGENISVYLSDAVIETNIISNQPADEKTGGIL